MTPRRTKSFDLLCMDGVVRRARTQKANWDCGPACLRTLATYHAIPLERAKRAVEESGGTPKRGTSQAGMFRGLEALRLFYGHIGRPTQPESWEHLDRAIALKHPAIICLDNDEHWVVLFGKARVRYWMYDPELGMRWLSPKNLKKRWRTTTGVYSFIEIHGEYK